MDVCCNLLSDEAVKGLRLLFDFNGKLFKQKDPSRRPIPRMFTLDAKGDWREVQLKTDPAVWEPLWAQHGLEDWIVHANGCQSAGLEFSNRSFKVLRDGLSICDIPDFQDLIEPKAQSLLNCSWLEKLGEFSQLEKEEQREVLMKQFVYTQVLAVNWSHRSWLAWEIEYQVTQKMKLLRIDSQVPEVAQTNLVAIRSLARMLKGVAGAYHASGKSYSTAEMKHFRRTCLQLSERVASLQGKSIRDAAFKQVEADIGYFLKRLRYHLEHFANFPKQVQQLDETLHEADPYWICSATFCKLLCCDGMNKFVRYFMDTVVTSHPQQAVEPTSHRVGGFFATVRDKKLTFCLSDQYTQPHQQITLSEHITQNGNSNIEVTVFRGNQVLVQNRQLLRISFCLVDLGLAAQALCHGTTENGKPTQLIHYKRPLPAVVRSKLRYSNHQNLEPPCIYLSARGITVLHKMYLQNSDHALPGCVRKLTLSYIRPTLAGKQRNWVQLDLKGLTKHAWGYSRYPLRPAILTDEKQGRIFVATGHTLMGTSAYINLTPPVVELECYKIDWAGGKLSLAIEHKIPLDQNDGNEKGHEWRLVGGIVFYSFFNRMKKQVLLYCFHKGAFTPASKSTPGLAAGAHSLSDKKVTEVMLVVEGTSQPYPLGRKVAETINGHIVHRFFRLRPTF